MTGCFRNNRLQSLTAGFLFAFILTLFFAPCAWAGKGGKGKGSGPTYVSGEIRKKTTWDKKDSPVIVTGNLRIINKAALKIKKGVEVRFEAGVFLSVENGVLDVNGSKKDPVLFTSNSPTPAPGDWGGIIISPDSGSRKSKLMECVVEYGGAGGTAQDANIRIDNSAAPVELKKCVVKNSAGSGVAVLSSEIKIQDCEIIDNAHYGVWADAGSTGIIKKSSFSGNGINPLHVSVGIRLEQNQYSGSGDQAIEIPAGEISEDVSLENLGIPYAVSGDLVLASGEGDAPVLTIEDGVRIEFDTGARLIIQEGALNAQGTMETPIVFTSQDSSPGPGSWGGILFLPGADGQDTLLENCVVEFGGAGGGEQDANIVFKGVTLSHDLKNIQVRQSAGSGLVFISATARVDSCDISNNGQYGIWSDAASTISVSGNQINNNGKYPLRVRAQLDVQGNGFSGNAKQAIEVIGGVPSEEPLLAFNGWAGVWDDSALLLAQATEIFGGDILGDTTWANEGVPYVVTGDVRVGDWSSPPATLTIQAGVEVRFEGETGLEIGFSWGGSSYMGALDVRGSSGAPIVFTSHSENPQPGDWKGIFLSQYTDGAATFLEHCTMEYGGQGGESNDGMANLILYQFTLSNPIQNSVFRYSEGAGVWLGSANAQITNCQVSNNKGYGIWSNETCQLTATNNSFSHNGGGTDYTAYPLRVNAQMGESGVSENTFSDNSIQAIEVLGGLITQNTVWHNQGVPFVVAGTVEVGVTGNSLAALTLQEGLEARFAQGTGLIIGKKVAYDEYKGALFAQGSLENPILFTSDEASPSPGDWNGIYFSDYADQAASLMEYCTVEYGGNENNANVRLNNAAIPITKCSFLNSSQSGLYLDGSGCDGLVVECNNFKDNLYGVTTSAAPVLTGNNIYTNLIYGVDYSGGATLNIDDNWWGDADPPVEGTDYSGAGVQVASYLDQPSGCIEAPPINSNPHQPREPNPEDKAVRVTISPTLTWLGGDPNGWDTVSYDVALGESPQSLGNIATGLASPAHALTPTLDPGTVYYWQVTATDNYGLSTTGPVWMFVTAGGDADLEMADISWSPSPRLPSGVLVTFTAEIRNSNTDFAVVDPFSVDFQVDGESIAMVPVNTVIPKGGTLNVETTWIAVAGSHTLTVTADAFGTVSETDEANNSLSEALPEVVVDTTPPQLVSTVPADRAFLWETNDFVITLSDAHGYVDDAAVLASLAFTGLGIPVPFSVSESNDVFTLVPDSLPLPDGEFQVDFTARDISGNEASHSITFFIDNQPPAPPVINPVTSPTPNAAQTITGTKEAYASIWMNGMEVVSHTLETTWQVIVNLVEGDNIFYFTAVDRAGNLSTDVDITIFYDDQAPEPVDNLIVSGEANGSSASLSWAGYDETAHGDISLYRIYVEDAFFTDVSGLETVDTVPAGTFTYTATGLDKGETYYFAVVAQDLAGNINPEMEAKSALIVDVVAPDEVTDLAVASYATALAFSWTPSADTDNDLAGYTVFLDGVELENLAPSETAYTVSNLDPDTALTFTISTFDTDGNVSGGSEILGVTTLRNPGIVAITPYSGWVHIQWQPVEPAQYVAKYNIYVNETAFTSVEGMTPRLSDTGSSASLAALTNNVNYFFAVTTVNLSGGENKDVSPVTATPVPDTLGPEVVNVRVNGQLLSNGQVLTRPGNFYCEATDPAGVSRIAFYANGILLNTDYSPDYTAYWNTTETADGAHDFTITAYDTLGNTTVLGYSITVALEPPGPPAITFPEDGAAFNKSFVSFSGTADQHAEVTLYNDAEQALSEAVSVGDDGTFRVSAWLEEGAHTLHAKAQNRAGQGPASAPVNLTMDFSIPDPPANITAAAGADGIVRLRWEPPLSTSVDGYNIYRSETSFADAETVADLVDAEQVNNVLARTTSAADTTSSDTTWFYRLTTKDLFGNESKLSAEVSASTDSGMPRALSIQYHPQGPYDPASGRMGPGRVDVVVTVSETLLSTPFLSITPLLGFPMTVELARVSDTEYTGSFDIEPSTPSGTAWAVFSCRDQAGNRGTEIDSGETVEIDTQGPSVIRLEIDPATPIQNDSQDPVEIFLTLGLDEAVPSGQTPWLAYTLGGESHVVAVTETSPEPGEAQAWQGSFILAPEAGQSHPEMFSFSFAAEDDLGNPGDKISCPNLFEVYQGQLPALETPTGLTALARPHGEVFLSWNPVTGASGYRLYRQAPGDAEMTLRQELGSILETTDLTLIDGETFYSISSLREVLGEVAESPLSAPVSVNVDSLAPEAPEGLALSLTASGIQAQYSPVANAVSYSLYRSDAEIVSVAGLMPIISAAPDTTCLDPEPSSQDHWYAVTALDAAGNESGPSVSAYLNFTLLPVPWLDVVIQENQPPRVSWGVPDAQDLAGYKLYLGPDEDLVSLTASSIPEKFYTDTGYDRTSRRYTLVAVDAAQAEGPGRSVTLPLAGISPASGPVLRTNLMNRLEYTVENSGNQIIENARVLLNLAGMDHLSEVFSLDPGQEENISVTVPGYPHLEDEDPARITASLVITTTTGETARIMRTDEIAVRTGMPVLHVFADELVRGTDSQVRFTLENTGGEELEIITARNTGASPSDEIFLSLMDHDENVLCYLPFYQALGENVVTLPNGTTVARIPAGGFFSSEPVSLSVPEGAPGYLILEISINQVHHKLGTDGQLSMQGPSSSIGVSLANTSYYSLVTAVEPETIFNGDSVTISGQAIERATGQPLAGVPLTVYVSIDGFDTAYNVLTDGEGGFSRQFSAHAGKSGRYSAWAAHPDVTTRSAQVLFDVLGVEAVPSDISLSLPRNYEKRIDLAVSAGHDTPAENLRLEFLAEDQPDETLPQGVTVVLPDPIALAPEGFEETLSLTIWASNNAPETGTLVLRLASDNGPENGWQKINIEFAFSDSTPSLFPEPGYLEVGLAAGETAVETVKLKNRGFAALEDVQASLSTVDGNPAPDWMILNTEPGLGDIRPGEELIVSLGFSPTGDTDEGIYQAILHVEAANYPARDILLICSVTSSGTGNALFKVEDIYTGTLDEQGQAIQGLANARVLMQNEEVWTEEYSLDTDEAGEALFEDLPAGMYKYRVRAAQHNELTGRIEVRPGLTANELVMLPSRLISFEWKVTETTVADQYQTDLTVSYETEVPAAVVVVEPMSITLPVMDKGDVYYGEITITNHGLVKAEEFTMIPGQESDRISIEYLGDLPDEIGIKQSITVPYRVTCLKSFVLEPDGDDTGAAGTGGYVTAFVDPDGDGVYEWKWQCHYLPVVDEFRWKAKCANGQWEVGGTKLIIFWGECKTVEGATWEQPLPSKWYGDPLFGPPTWEPIDLAADMAMAPSYIPINGTPCDYSDFPTPDDIANVPVGADELECYPDTCGGEDYDIGAICKRVYSQVNTLRGDYNRRDRDLKVKVQGGYLGMERTYYAGKWHFGPEKTVPGESDSVFRYYATNPLGVWRPDAGFQGLPFTMIPGDCTGQAHCQSGETYDWHDIVFRGKIFKYRAATFADDRMGVVYKSGSETITRICDIDYPSVVYNFRWEDKHGRWEEYYGNHYWEPDNSPDRRSDAGGVAFLRAFGDSNGTVGNAMYNTYGDTVRVVGWKDRYGNQALWYEYDPEGLVSAVQDAAGRRVEYDYTDGRLTTVTDVLGIRSHYEYDGEGRMKKIIQPSGMTINIHYTDTGKIASVTDGNGVGKSFVYGYSELTETYYSKTVSPNGKIEETWVDTNLKPVQTSVNDEVETQTFGTWNANDQGTHTQTVKGAAGNTTYQKYDEWDNLVETIYPDGSRVKYGYEHTFNKIIKETNQMGVITEYEYDENGNRTRMTEAVGTDVERTTEWEYDDDGNLITQRRLGDSNTEEAVTTYTYDAAGNRETETGPEGNTTTYTYDIMGNVLTRKDPLGNVWTNEYNAIGLLTRTIDPLGYSNTFDYDETGNKVEEIDSRGRITRYEYDDQGNMTKLIDALGNATVYEYDEEGRLVKTKDPEGHETRQEYDQKGQIKKAIDGMGNETKYEYEDSLNAGCSSCSGNTSTGQPMRVIYPTYAEEYVYDDKGRKIETRQILSETEIYTTTYEYDTMGNLVSQTDANGIKTRFEYDDMGRKAKQINALGDATTYEYNSRNNLIALTDANGNTTYFEYDKNNRTTRETRPLSQETVYTYNENGQLKQKLDAVNNKAENIYDDSGRLQKTRYYEPGDHTTPIKIVTYAYDPVGNMLSYDDSITSGIYTYDAMNRKLTETVDFGSFSKGYSYTYYKTGLIKSFTDPENRTYGYTYNANNQLTGIDIPGHGTITYSAYQWNRPTRVFLPGGSTKEYAYDALMRTNSIKALDPAGNTMMDYAYTHDKVGNILTKTTEHGPYIYGYDNIYQLTSADNPTLPDEAFTYDPVGNRLTAQGVADDYTYNQNNELLSYAGADFTYDLNGSTSSKIEGSQTTKYIYNSEGRLWQMRGADGLVAEYYYDPFGRRLWKDIAGEKIYFLYTDTGLNAEYDETATEIKSYGFVPNSLWTTDPVFMQVDGEYYFYQNDHLGSPKIITDTSGMVVWSAIIYSFGKTLIDPASSLTNNLRFPGQFYDNENGLNYNHYRYYSPLSSVYYRNDPISFNSGTTNLFTYSNNSPISNYDSHGLKFTYHGKHATKLKSMVNELSDNVIMSSYINYLKESPVTINIKDSKTSIGPYMKVNYDTLDYLLDFVADRKKPDPEIVLDVENTPAFVKALLPHVTKSYCGSCYTAEEIDEILLLISFAHELFHAYDFLQDPQDFFLNSGESFREYNNVVEYKAISVESMLFFMYRLPGRYPEIIRMPE